MGLNDISTRTLSRPQLLYLGSLALLTLVAFGLRIYCLDCQSLRGDEAISATYSSRSPAEILEISRLSEPHPPLFYLVMHGWEALTGFSEFSVRLWALLPSVLMVPSVYYLARHLIDRETGVVAAFLMTINSFHIWHSQDARSYTWFALLGLWAAIFFWQSLRRNHWQDWVRYALSIIVLVYLHYYGAFLIAFHGVYLLWYSAKQQTGLTQYLIRWGLAIAGACLVFTPWFWLSWQFIAQYTADLDQVLPGTVLWRGLQAFSGGVIEPTPSVVWWAWPFVMLVIAGLWRGWRSRQPAATNFLLGYLVFPFIGVMALTLRGQAFTERYLIAALPAYLILMAAGTMWLLRNSHLLIRWVASLSLILGLWFNLQTLREYHIDPELAKSPEWRPLFDYIATAQNPVSDILIYNFPEASVTYYTDTNRESAPDGPPKLPAFLVPFNPNQPRPIIDQTMQTLLASYERVWFLPINATGWDDANHVETWLVRHADRVDEANFHWARGSLYLTPTTIDQIMAVQAASFASGASLRGFYIANPQPNQQGQVVLTEGSLDLSLYWQVDHPTQSPLTVFTQLIDPSGFRRGGQDNQPVWGTYPTTDWQPGERITDKYHLSLEPDSPPGVYQIWVGLYDPQTGERVMVIDDEGQPVADHMVLSVPIIVE